MEPQIARTSTLAIRLAAKCGPRDENGCIPWLGNVINSGYGHIRRGGRKEGFLLAHRAAWEVRYGPIPEGLFVLHGCDNKRCTNVEHLRLGTQGENVRDALDRGQHPFASKPPQWTKVPVERLPEVFAMRASGFTQQKIADELGVSRPLISLLLSGKLKRKSYAVTGKGDSN